MNKDVDICEMLHKEISKLPRYNFPFSKKDIYKNGIYILFEKGESGHDTDRIVRIGTHRGPDNLCKRLEEHFLKENKDRSIFRKNIGRAILNKRKDPYLDIWEIDFIEKKQKEKYGHLYDGEYQSSIEKEVSEYIRNNLSFSVIEVNDVKERLYYESKLISTVSLCKKCNKSKNWLGNYSPKEKIRESGLWVVNELYKSPFTIEEFQEFKDKYIKVK